MTGAGPYGRRSERAGSGGRKTHAEQAIAGALSNHRGHGRACPGRGRRKLRNVRLRTGVRVAASRSTATVPVSRKSLCANAGIRRARRTTSSAWIPALRGNDSGQGRAPDGSAFVAGGRLAQTAPGMLAILAINTYKRWLRAKEGDATRCGATRRRLSGHRFSGPGRRADAFRALDK